MTPIETLQAICEAWNRLDNDALAELFADDGVFEDPLHERALLLDRPYALPWDHTAAELERAGARLDALRSAAGRTAGSDSGAGAVLDRLVDDLDVPAAWDIAVEEGGQAARDLISVLAL